MMTTSKEAFGCVRIRDVWADNLHEEFELMRGIVHNHPYIAMDTEFPGVVIRPAGGLTFSNSAEYNYETLRLNVDRLKLIQLGLTFTDEHGNLPKCNTTGEGCVWQFNFREFRPSEDLHAVDSIDLLRRSGIDFQMNEEKGIDSFMFAQLFLSSGIAFNKHLQWITFHSAYDFGYLLKMLTRQSLPYGQVGFFNLMRVFFPNFYDIKHMMRYCDNLHGGLSKVAEKLKVERVGCSHQAGSDSLLTSCTYMKLKHAAFFHGPTEKYAGVLFGLALCRRSIDHQFIVT